jgi:hypothetical protein
MSIATFLKDPNAVLDYQIDWSPWLGADTIATSAWTVPSGITKDSDTKTATTVTVWLSSGVAGTKYALTNRITTAGGRTDDRTITISVKER